jgi:hypothetical protein
MSMIVRDAQKQGPKTFRCLPAGTEEFEADRSTAGFAFHFEDGLGDEVASLPLYESSFGVAAGSMRSATP